MRDYMTKKEIQEAVEVFIHGDFDIVRMHPLITLIQAQSWGMQSLFWKAVDAAKKEAGYNV